MKYPSVLDETSQVQLLLFYTPSDPVLGARLLRSAASIFTINWTEIVMIGFYTLVILTHLTLFNKSLVMLLRSALRNCS